MEVEVSEQGGVEDALDRLDEDDDNGNHALRWDLSG